MGPKPFQTPKKGLLRSAPSASSPASNLRSRRDLLSKSHIAFNIDDDALLHLSDDEGSEGSINLSGEGDQIVQLSDASLSQVQLFDSLLNQQVALPTNSTATVVLQRLVPSVPIGQVVPVAGPSGIVPPAPPNPLLAAPPPALVFGAVHAQAAPAQATLTERLAIARVQPDLEFNQADINQVEKLHNWLVRHLDAPGKNLKPSNFDEIRALLLAASHLKDHHIIDQVWLHQKLRQWYLVAHYGWQTANLDKKQREAQEVDVVVDGAAEWGTLLCAMQRIALII